MRRNTRKNIQIATDDPIKYIAKPFVTSDDLSLTDVNNLTLYVYDGEEDATIILRPTTTEDGNYGKHYLILNPTEYVVELISPNDEFNGLYDKLDIKPANGIVEILAASDVKMYVVDGATPSYRVAEVVYSYEELLQKAQEEASSIALAKRNTALDAGVTYNTVTYPCTDYDMIQIRCMALRSLTEPWSFPKTLINIYGNQVVVSVEDIKGLIGVLGERLNEASIEYTSTMKALSSLDLDGLNGWIDEQNGVSDD